MQTGKVARLHRDKGFGFIQPDAGGRLVFFHRSAFQGPFESLEGAPVQFEVEDTEKGPRAVRVSRIGGAPAAAPAAAAAPRARSSRLGGATRFLNPYNFVRPAPVPASEEAASDAGALLLGRCAPPPRDRYVGLTGRATCRITTLTPVFVSDPYEVKVSESEHQSFRFFRDWDQVPCIPGSTLRGVVRSVFEAVTSSCWELVSPRTLSRRVQTGVAAALVPGRLVRDGEDWFLEVLAGDTAVSLPDGPVKEGEPLYAAWVPCYGRGGAPLAPRASRSPALAPDEAQAYDERGFPSLPDGLVHGDAVVARLRLTEHSRPGGGNEFLFWNVEALGGSEAEVEAGRQPGDLVVCGYYCKTGFNINRKHDERFFFTTRPAPRRLPIKPELVARYVALLADYRELHQREVGTERKDGTKPSRFVETGEPSRASACDGELVYAWLEGRNAEGVHALAPVSVPRLFYDRSIGDRFPPNAAVTPCSHLNDDVDALRLCPACRVFGWVRNPRGEEPAEAPRIPAVTATRSRVRFGGARFTRGALDETSRQLDILSSPKPTTVRFYLMPAKGGMRPVKSGERVENTKVDYNRSHMVVRGRKFYRSHRQVELRPPEKRSGQNRTLREWLKPEQSASFEVDFECLAPVELGALLWALEQQPGFVHRLGFGKPLGLGTVKIEVTGLALHGAERYAAEPAAGAEAGADPRAYVEPLKECFRRAMERRYGAEFAALPNVADLAALLSDTPPDLPVSYPSLNDDRYPESFHWFVVNNGRQYRDRPAAGRGVWLPIAAEDDGLPVDPAAP
jgi:CRISPR-associated protein (TIGR03986 family)